MKQILSAITVSSFKEIKTGGGDDGVCQLSSRITPTILAGISFFVAVRHYVQAPIKCWCPAHFTKSHVEFTNNVCWLTNTYYLDFYSHIPKEDEEHLYISYYQWVPLILACQAIMFYLPRALWNLLNKRSGVAVHTITDAAVECQSKVTPQDRQHILEYMSNHMGRFLMDCMTQRKQTSLSYKKAAWWLYGGYLTITYIFVKAVYCTNAVVQLFVLNLFLGMDTYHNYGIQVMKSFFNGQNWSTSDRFPRITLCDTETRWLGNVHRYTIQCSLPMNLFNEIIFIFIWFWFVFLTILSAWSLLHWAWICFYRYGQINYMYGRILTMDSFTEDTENIEREDIQKFVKKFLKGDGCFIIRLVSENTSDVIAAEFLYKLWHYYHENQSNIERVNKEARERHEAIEAEDDDDNHMIYETAPTLQVRNQSEVSDSQSTPPPRYTPAPSAPPSSPEPNQKT